jgi:O-antigen/teichoic acid export membrane protein
MQNLIRNASYIFWSFAEQVSTMAIPRLMLWPLAAYWLGKEQFGIFIYAFSIASIISVQPGNGLATGLLRHLSDYDEEHREQLCGIAMRLCNKAMIFVVLIGLVCCIAIGSSKLMAMDVINCLIPSIISLHSENQTHLLLTESRYRRKFRGRAIWFLIRSFINLAGGIAGMKAAGLVGLAWGSMVGNIIIYAILRIQYNKWFKVPDNAEMAGVLKKVWLHITIAGIIAFSGPYLNRIILGTVAGFEETADLVAATAVTYIFLAPMMCISGLLLSIISKYTSILDFSRQARLQWLFMLIFGAVISPFGLMFFASNIMHILYPNFGDESVKLLKILIWMVMSESAVNLFRPFVMKFGSVRLVPIINSASLATTLIPAVCLIPIYGTIGAAWAIVFGSITTGILWVAATGWIYFRSKKLLKITKNS